MHPLGDPAVLRRSILRGRLAVPAPIAWRSRLGGAASARCRAPQAWQPGPGKRTRRRRPGSQRGVERCAPEDLRFGGGISELECCLHLDGSGLRGIDRRFGPRTIAHRGRRRPSCARAPTLHDTGQGVTPATCPLCGDCDGEAVFSLEYASIWDALDREWSASISSATRVSSAPTDTTQLVRCRTCGLEWFDPLVPGGSEFYRELMSAMPYNPGRWEFDVAAGRISPDQAVVDLGCGEGAFLRLLGKRPGRRVGIDINGPAIDHLVSTGIEAYVADFTGLRPNELGEFDVITAFHLLEHVYDPLAVVLAGKSCLRPDGRMLLSVPNRDRSHRSGREPLDCPPHHVTRWSVAQLHELAERAGLRVRHIDFEPPDLSVARELVRNEADPLLRWLPLGARRQARRAWGRLAMSPRGYVRRTREAGFAKRGIFGHAVLVELAVEGR